MLPGWGELWYGWTHQSPQSVTDGGGVSAMVLKELARNCLSHSPVHGFLDGDCYDGARGRGTREEVAKMVAPPATPEGCRGV
jgi:hypothetical protein